MSHKKTAKALAMLALENGELRAKVGRLEARLQAARAVADAATISAIEAHAEAAQEADAEVSDLQAKLNSAHGDYQRLQANLAAMQRDRDALAAEVWTLRVAVAEKVRAAPQPQIAGKVVSEHGPCEDGDGLVRQVVARASWLSPERRAFVLRRLTAGEDKYGTPLLLGWSRAREALEEEMADGIAYAIAAGDSDGAKALAVVWERMPSLGGEVPPMDVPHAGPWMAAAEVAGKVPANAYPGRWFDLNPLYDADSPEILGLERMMETVSAEALRTETDLSEFAQWTGLDSQQARELMEMLIGCGFWVPKYSGQFSCGGIFELDYEVHSAAKAGERVVHPETGETVKPDDLWIAYVPTRKLLDLRCQGGEE